MSSEKPKDPNAVALGRKGGIARARKLSPERRQAIAEKASSAARRKKQRKHKPVTEK